MNKATERILAFLFGVIFVIALLVLAVVIQTPTPFQYTVFRIVLALAAGGVASMIPGFLEVTISNWLRAGGALAVFVVVYFFNPAQLTGVQVKTAQQVEIEKSIVTASRSGNGQSLIDVVVDNPDTMSKPEFYLQRYNSITIQVPQITVPTDVTLVTNELLGINNAKLIGTQFSVVARRIANLIIDVSGQQDTGKTAGSLWLYVKTIENAKLLTIGVVGVDGKNGDSGKDGIDGANGRNGNCEGFGRYESARPGGDGGNGENGGDGLNGSDGSPGGKIVLMTIVNPIASVIDILGGKGGQGGKGGAFGKGGRGGSGGGGCTGLGGSQENEKDGKAGTVGVQGRDEASGSIGKPGEYRLFIVDSFDKVLKVIDAYKNEDLHAKLLVI